MKKNECGPASPQTIRDICNTLFAVNIHKRTGHFYEDYTPSRCEECGDPTTERDEREAIYADNHILCGKCRTAYMELHHSDPFCLTGGSAA